MCLFFIDFFQNDSSKWLIVILLVLLYFRCMHLVLFCGMQGRTTNKVPRPGKGSFENLARGIRRSIFGDQIPIIHQRFYDSR